MQKKNVLTMALSVSLVGVIAVGGTLAYLTSNTGVVTNTFTTSASIKMNLTENYYVDGVLQTDDDENPIRTEQGSTYKDVLPGVSYEKDPAVQMTSVPTGGAYVFMAVTGLDKDADTDKYTVDTTIDNAWKKITTGEGKDGLYVYVGDDQVADKWETKQSGDARMEALFENVSFAFSNDFNDDADENGDPDNTIDDIKVVAYAAQAQGTDFATVASNAHEVLMGDDALNVDGFTLNNEVVAAVNPDASAD